MSIVKFVRVDCAQGPLIAMSAGHAPDTVEALSRRFESLRERREGSGCQAILFVGRDSKGALSGFCLDALGRPSQAGVHEALRGLAEVNAIPKDSVVTINGQSMEAVSDNFWRLSCQGHCFDGISAATDII